MATAPVGRFTSHKVVSKSKSHDWPDRRGFVRLHRRQRRRTDGGRAMWIGHARVSTHDQNIDLQEDAFKGAGCKKCYTDRTGGARARRPGGRGPGPRAARQFARGLEAGPARAKPQATSSKTLADLSNRGLAFRSLPEAIDTTISGGKLDLLTLRRPGRVRAGHHPRRPGRHPGPWAERGPAPQPRRQGQAHATMLQADPSNSVKDIRRRLGISKATLLSVSLRAAWSMIGDAGGGVTTSRGASGTFGRPANWTAVR